VGERSKKKRETRKESLDRLTGSSSREEGCTSLVGHHPQTPGSRTREGERERAARWSAILHYSKHGGRLVPPYIPKVPVWPRPRRRSGHTLPQKWLGLSVLAFFFLLFFPSSLALALRCMTRPETSDKGREQTRFHHDLPRPARPLQVRALLSASL